MLEKVQWTKKGILLTLNGEEILVHKDAYLEANLEVGDEVDLDDLLYRSDFFYGMEKAKGYLSRGPRTRMQLRDYLNRRGFSTPAEEILNVLSDYGLLNDREYALSYYEEHRHKKGSFAIKALLQQKGISSSVLESLPMEEDPEDAALILVKKYSDWEELSYEEEVKRKNFLLSRGFSYETINKAINLAKKWNK